MQQPVDHNLIKKYLKGACNPEEVSRIRDFMLLPEAREMFDDVLSEGWNEDAEADKRQLKLWNARFQNRLAEQQNNVQNNHPRTWLKYAAALALFILVGCGLFWKYTEPNNMPAAMQETANTYGKLIKIKLNDGSNITINAASKIKYPETFNSKTREVYLDGEAFFDVAHDAEHPFIVHTPKVIINVLGTSFNVRAYKGDKHVAVAVATGKVGVLAHGHSKAYMLLPGDELAYNIENIAIAQNKVKTDEISAWQSGMFIYHDETLANICTQLEHWYGVSITIKSSSAAQQRFNLKQKNDSIENVLSTLKFAGKINYRINGKQITIW